MPYSWEPREFKGYGMLIGLGAWLMFAHSSVAQNPDALSPNFEGKQVVVKIDMPGTQKGVEIYPDRTPTLDSKSYGDRMKDFGVSLRQGDTTMVTKVKVNKDNVEFQLGGGGFGTARDNADTSVHFTPAEKSDREKELERQLSNETDPDRRRSLQRELDYVRRDRERKDAYNRARAEDDAARQGSGCRDQAAAGWIPVQHSCGRTEDGGLADSAGGGGRAGTVCCLRQSAGWAWWTTKRSESRWDSGVAAADARSGT